MGLRIMNYRANTIGASLEIRARGREGTVVSCGVKLSGGEGLRKGRRMSGAVSANGGREAVHQRP
jgi:hypothetical protein